MTDDQQTYRRATSAALLGLATQAVLALIMAGLSLYTRSGALNAAMWHFFGGLPIWVALWMLYNQHRLEREEALEAEQLAREDARAAALFDEAGHNLATARKRLESFYKWGLSAVSIGVAVYLVAAGVAMCISRYRLIEPTETGTSYQALLNLALGNDGSHGSAGVNGWMVVGFAALLAFLGFLVARYIAGMTRLSAWQLLRGGAAYLIGNVVVTLLVMVAMGVYAVGGNKIGLATLSLLIPAFMVILGIETLLAFVFGIYRPRKADEVVRPAFDSRLLGWLTQPESIGKIVSETLNYQFGFEITKSWFYVLLGRALAPLIAAGVVMLLALSSVVIVAPNQQAVVTTMGALNPETGIREPGLSFKAPWPLARAVKYEVGRSRQMVIGTYEQSQRVEGKATLWNNDHVEGKVEYLATAPTMIDDPALRRRVEQELEGQEGFEGSDRTSSTLGGLIALQAVVTYDIGDLGAYVSAGSASRPEQLLSAIAQRHLNALVATKQIDDLLGADRVGTGDELLALIREDVGPHGYDLGLNIKDVLLYDIHPPKDGEVADAFLQQVNAIQSQKTAVENAQRDAIGTLSSAAGSRGDALRIEAAIQALYALRDRAAGQENTDEALQQQIIEQEGLINRLIDDAGGEAARILADARLARWRTALNEKSEAARFDFELAAYNYAPEYFKARYYLDAVSESFQLSNRRVISTVPSDEPSTYRLDLEDLGSAADLLSSPSPD